MDYSSCPELSSFFVTLNRETHMMEEKREDCSLAVVLKTPMCKEERVLRMHILEQQRQNGLMELSFVSGVCLCFYFTQLHSHLEFISDSYKELCRVCDSKSMIIHVE